MALRQFAVFMNAGSYVISPKSSASVLICRRSMARIVPSCDRQLVALPGAVVGDGQRVGHKGLESLGRPCAERATPFAC